MKKTFTYNVVAAIGRVICPRSTVNFEGGEPTEPGIIVCNHSSIRGPVMMTLYYGRPHKNWIISYALEREKTANFAFHDFFVGEGRRVKWFWRLLSKIVAKILPGVLSQAGPIAVYHDSRIIKTFRNTMAALSEGYDVVVFGESPERYSEYVNRMQLGIIDVAALYYKRTGKKLKIYPAYIEKKNRLIEVAPPIEYGPELDKNGTCEKISSEIDRMARGMKKHKPVPFLPERWYRTYGRYEHDFDKYWQMIDKEQ